jgi:prefoldin subunit 5
VHDRLKQLKSELEKGQQEMARLDLRRQELRDTMLRISGAIQVLEELKAQETSPHPQPEQAAAIA